jgi:hypothetical protein
MRVFCLNRNRGRPSMSASAPTRRNLLGGASPALPRSWRTCSIQIYLMEHELVFIAPILWAGTAWATRRRYFGRLFLRIG